MLLSNSIYEFLLITYLLFFKVYLFLLLFFFIILEVLIIFNLLIFMNHVSMSKYTTPIHLFFEKSFIINHYEVYQKIHIIISIFIFHHLVKLDFISFSLKFLHVIILLNSITLNQNLIIIITFMIIHHISFKLIIIRNVNLIITLNMIQLLLI